MAPIGKYSQFRLKTHQVLMEKLCWARYQKGAFWGNLGSRGGAGRTKFSLPPVPGSTVAQLVGKKCGDVQGR